MFAMPESCVVAFIKKVSAPQNRESIINENDNAQSSRETQTFLVDNEREKVKLLEFVLFAVGILLRLLASTS